MKFIGAILCGGKATRLPNKPLLPYLQDGGKMLRPLIHSSVDYLRIMNIEHVVLLDTVDSIIAPVLTAAYPDMMFYRSVDSFEGIPAALAKMAHSIEDTDIMYVVLCCDNLYPPGELFVRHETDSPCAVVRTVVKEDVQHLSKWDRPTRDTGKWVTRHIPSTSLTALTSPWFLTADILRQGGNHHDIVGLLNEFQVPPWTRPCRGWRDLGTEDSYIRYWADIHEQTLKDRQAGGNISSVELLCQGFKNLHPIQPKD